MLQRIRELVQLLEGRIKDEPVLWWMLLGVDVLVFELWWLCWFVR